MNDYTLYLVKRAYYKKQLIKRAFNFGLTDEQSKDFLAKHKPSYTPSSVPPIGPTKLPDFRPYIRKDLDKIVADMQKETAEEAARQREQAAQDRAFQDQLDQEDAIRRSESPWLY